MIGVDVELLRRAGVEVGEQRQRQVVDPDIFARRGAGANPTHYTQLARPKRFELLTPRFVVCF